MLYIAGPMSHYPDLNRKAFADADDRLTAVGYVVHNPAPFEQNGWSQTEYLRWALRAMLTCDGVATLPQWHESWGADIEVRTAHSVLLPVLPVARWIQREPT
jgi:hypothetical protein